MTIDADKLRALDAAATAGKLSTAEFHTVEEFIECPVCQGDGEVLSANYCNFDDKALGVQFYGIGPEFGAHEALWSFLRNAVPAILAQADRIAVLEGALREAQEALQDTVRSSVRNTVQADALNKCVKALGNARQALGSDT